MKFFTPFDRPPRKPETFTNKEQKVYKASINRETGRRELKVKDTINIYEKIQEYADDVKLENIIQRYNVNMLSNALKSKEQELIDLSNMPENLLETMAIIDNARYIFDRQSVAIKQKFNNDFRQFIASSETGQLAELLNKELKTDLNKFNQLSDVQRANIIQNNKSSQVQPSMTSKNENLASNDIELKGGAN